MPFTERVRKLLPSLVTGAVVVVAQVAWSWSALHRDITTDESFTFFSTNGGVSGLVSAGRMDPAMWLYYLVGHVWARMFPDSIVALRWLTVLIYAAIVVIVCELARRRGRWWAAPLGLVAFGATPIAREAVVDARAAIPASLVAVVLMILADRLVRSVDAPDRIRWVRAVAVVICALVFIHPSGIGAAGVAWLVLAWVAYRGNLEERFWTVAALGAAAIAFLANLMQAGNIDGLVESGFAGFRFTLGLLWGGNALIAAIVIVGTAVVLAIDARRDALAGLAGLASVGWTLALALAVPVVTMFIARYLVIACVLLVLAGVTVASAQWRNWALLGFAAVSIVGGIISHDRAPGPPSRWCSLADQLDAAAGAGDLVVFPSGAAITATTACLGDARSDALVARVDTVPDIDGLERTNPRSMWMLTVDATDLGDEIDASNTERMVVLRTHEPAPGTDEFLEAFVAGGGACVDQLSDGQGITVCTGNA